AGEDRDRRAARRERPRDGEADAGGAAGHERDLLDQLARGRDCGMELRLGHALLPAAASAVRVAVRLSGSSTFQLIAVESIDLRSPRSTLPVPSSTNPSTPCARR